MSSKELRELEKIIGSLQKASSKESLGQADHKRSNDSLFNRSNTEDNATIIYDEFVPPSDPPPNPPNNEVSPTVVFQMAPPPPAPLSTQNSLSNLDQILSKGSPGPQLKYPKPVGKLKNSHSVEQLYGPPADVVYPPSPPSRGNKSRYNSQDVLDNPEEYDFGEENENEKMEEQNRRREVARMSQMIRFDKATVDDFRDLDNLLTDLDRIFHKSGIRNPGPNPHGMRPLPNPAVDAHRQRQQQGALPPPLIYPKPVHDDTSSGLTVAAENLEAAVFSIDNMRKTSSKEKLSEDADSDDAQKEEKIRAAMMRINEANVRKITIRIYIEHAKSFKTLVLTSLMSAEYVVEDMKKRYLLEESHKWTLFELINDVGIERPLRDYEIVTDVIKTWDVETVNALLIKRYKYRESLTLEGANESYPRMCGWLFIELKKGKWQKRFFELKAKGLYYSKDSKGSNEALLCSLSKYDVYTLIKSRSKAPTKFCFALKSSDSAKIFEDRTDYVYFLCVDHIDKMKDWVLSIRSAKSQSILDEHPEYLDNLPLKVLSKPTSMNNLAPSRSSDDLTKTAVRQRNESRPEPQKSPSNWKDNNPPPLIRKIEKQQGLLQEDNSQHVNRTQFGDNGKPLVPLTAKEIQNVPGVNVHKYVVPKPQQQEYQAEKNNMKMCATCGCTDFARNPFRETSCANCFHVHEERRTNGNAAEARAKTKKTGENISAGIESIVFPQVTKRSRKEVDRVVSVIDEEMQKLKRDMYMKKRNELERMYVSMQKANMELEKVAPELFKKAMIKDVSQGFPLERKIFTDSPPSEKL